MPKTTVGAIIEKNGKILITKRNVDPFKGYWVIPGGHVEKYETAEVAVKREIKEETGLDIHPRFLFYTDEIIRDKAGYNGHNVVLVFHARTKQEATINEECSEFKWVRPAEAVKLNLGFRNNEIIRKWLQN